MKNERKPVEPAKGKIIPPGTEQETGLTRWREIVALDSQGKPSKKKFRKRPPAM